MKPQDNEIAGGRRNKGFAATHQALIEGAVKLISEKGLSALSVAALARSVGINRTTVYYHFANRDELVDAVQSWSAKQLAQGFDGPDTKRERIDFISRFVLENPDLIKIWIEQYITGSDIRNSYPRWDELVFGTKRVLADLNGEQSIDAEVYCTLLLTGAIIGPIVFRNSVRPDLDAQTITARFSTEHERMLSLTLEKLLPG